MKQKGEKLAQTYRLLDLFLCSGSVLVSPFFVLASQLVLLHLACSLTFTGKQSSENRNKQFKKQCGTSVWHFKDRELTVPFGEVHFVLFSFS